MPGAKLLITGLANTGKTTLLKPLKNAFVVSRDGKPFSLEIPHTNIPDFDEVGDMLCVVQKKLDAYRKKFKKDPDTIVFDSVSTIFTDIVINCTNKHKNYAIWENVDKEINVFTSAVDILQNEGFNVILITHVVFDGDAKRYIETCAGKFAKKGGFLSTVDYALNIDLIGSKRVITHKNSNLSRTLLEDMPEKQDVNTFDLQEYLDKIQAKTSIVTEKWSI